MPHGSIAKKALTCEAAPVLTGEDTINIALPALTDSMHAKTWFGKPGVATGNAGG